MPIGPEKIKKIFRKIGDGMGQEKLCKKFLNYLACAPGEWFKSVGFHDGKSGDLWSLF
jgi:hypothetical protein